MQSSEVYGEEPVFDTHLPCVRNDDYRPQHEGWLDLLRKGHGAEVKCNSCFQELPEPRLEVKEIVRVWAEAQDKVVDAQWDLLHMPWWKRLWPSNVRKAYAALAYASAEEKRTWALVDRLGETKHEG
jgi:hypothetical protein